MLTGAVAVLCPECAEDQIQCAGSGTCWHYRAFCDGRAGCLSGADEPDVCTCRGFLWSEMSCGYDPFTRRQSSVFAITYRGLQAT